MNRVTFISLLSWSFLFWASSAFAIVGFCPDGTRIGPTFPADACKDHMGPPPANTQLPQRHCGRGSNGNWGVADPIVNSVPAGSVDCSYEDCVAENAKRGPNPSWGCEGLPHRAPPGGGLHEPGSGRPPVPVNCGAIGAAMCPQRQDWGVADPLVSDQKKEEVDDRDPAGPTTEIHTSKLGNPEGDNGVNFGYAGPVVGKACKSGEKQKVGCCGGVVEIPGCQTGAFECTNGKWVRTGDFTVGICL